MLVEIALHDSFDTSEEIQHAWGFEGVVDIQPTLIVDDYPARFQYREMAGDCRYVRADQLRQLADTFLACGKLIDYEKSRGMSECLDNPRPRAIEALSKRVEEASLFPVRFAFHFFARDPEYRYYFCS